MLHPQRCSIHFPEPSMFNKSQPKKTPGRKDNEVLKKEAPIFYKKKKAPYFTITLHRPSQSVNFKESLRLLRRHLLPDPVPYADHSLHDITQMQLEEALQLRRGEGVLWDLGGELRG
jgi:hypothetical protein